ncbi:efflux transporter outer membrane subunit [Zavarzinia compransoris]|uniref:efflux transporter outer membrane subunit n=1 Tax=Zavarzinia marina TaxID=2911065 RepID=UPI001F1BD4FC|nr:efflux transporter outer membrane subunit [Zavarzinia marina]MCF4166770.1 efflux transporter outer membrane subunit [Zavarzinia marina]
MNHASSIALAAALALAGCSYKSTPTPEVVTPPAAWAAPAIAGEGVWPAADWWQGFASPELAALVAAARTGNTDLAQAAARVAQAEASLRIAGASLWPSLGLSAGGDLRRPSGANDWSDSYSAALSASYEVDFWGANAADRAGAAAGLDASRFDGETVTLTVTASVASTYLQVLSLRDRLDVARRNLSIAEDVLALVEAKVGAGAASDLDLAQQRTVVAQRRAAVPPLEQNVREQLAALAVLLGLVPTGFDVAGTSLSPIVVPPLAAGMPSSLLQRRPDVKAAEARLAGADADIAAARAAFFPQVTLSAGLALSGAAAGDLFSLSDAAWSLGASLVQTIFDGGRREAQRDLAEARKVELLQSYRAAILAAFQDVEVALGAVDTLDRQRRLQDEVVAQARRALELAQIQYRAGASDLLSVLSAQQSLYSAEDQAAQIKLSALQARVTLYRVLGGGWSS